MGGKAPEPGSVPAMTPSSVLQRHLTGVHPEPSIGIRAAIGNVDLPAPFVNRDRRRYLLPQARQRHNAEHAYGSGERAEQGNLLRAEPPVGNAGARGASC